MSSVRFKKKNYVKRPKKLYIDVIVFKGIHGSLIRENFIPP